MRKPNGPVEPSPRVEMGFMNESTRGGCTFHIPDYHLLLNGTIRAASEQRFPHQDQSIVCNEEYDELHNHLTVDVYVNQCVRACVYPCERERERAHVPNSHIVQQLRVSYCTTAQEEPRRRSESKAWKNGHQTSSGPVRRRSAHTRTRRTINL